MHEPLLLCMQCSNVSVFPHWLAVCKMQTRQITHSILFQYSQHLALDTSSTWALRYLIQQFINQAMKSFRKLDLKSRQSLLSSHLHLYFHIIKGGNDAMDMIHSSVSGLYLSPGAWLADDDDLGTLSPLISHHSAHHTPLRTHHSPHLILETISSPPLSLQRTFKIETKPELMTN